jgi:hypothetical protein
MTPMIRGDFVSADEVKAIFGLDNDSNVLLAVLDQQCAGGGSPSGFVYVLYSYDNKLFQIANDYCEHLGVAEMSKNTPVERSVEELRFSLLRKYFVSNNERMPFSIDLAYALDQFEAEQKAKRVYEQALNVGVKEGQPTFIEIVGDNPEPDLQFIIQSPSPEKNLVIAELINRALMFGHGLMTETALNLSVMKFAEAFPQYYEQLTA